MGNVANPPNAGLLAGLESLARETPALQVMVLFGSAAAGRLGPESDLDLYIRLEPNVALSVESAAKLRRGAEELSGREVDLIVESSDTSVILRREVAARGRLVFERRPGAHRQLAVDAIHAYVDLEPYLSLIGRAARERARVEGKAARQRLLGTTLDHG